MLHISWSRPWLKSQVLKCYFSDKEHQKETSWRKKKKQWSLQVWVSLKNQSRRTSCTIQWISLFDVIIIIIIIFSVLSDPDLGSASSPQSPEYFSVLKRLPAAPWSRLSCHGLQSCWLNTKLKKVNQFCGLRENFPPRQKALTSIFPVSYNPRHRRTSLCSSTNEHSSLKKQSSLQRFARSVICICSIHPPYFATPTHFYSIRS